MTVVPINARQVTHALDDLPNTKDEVLNKALQFSASSDAHFKCIGCGKCCGSAPQLSISEAILLADEFPLAASLISMRTDVSLPGQRGQVAEMTIRRSAELGGLRTTVTTPEAKSIDFVSTLSAVVVDTSSLERCPVLQPDGKCGIYDRRPNVCRYVPAQHLIPKEQQNLSLSLFFELHGGDCDWSASAPPVLKNGVLVNQEMLDAFHGAERDDRKDAALLHALVDAGTVLSSGEGDIEFDDFIRMAITAPDSESRFPFAILALFLDDLKSRGDLPDGYPLVSAEDIARRQAKVCERLISENLIRKDSRDRNATNGLRQLLMINKEIVRFRESGQRF